MDQPTDKVVPLPMTPESTTDKPSDEVTPPLPSSVPESIVDQALNQIFAQAQMPTQQDGVIDITDDKSDMCFGSPIITLYAGPERIPVYVHKDVIAERSGYFERKFEDHTEDQKLFLNLPDDDPAIVNHFVRYMYRRGPSFFPEGETMDFEATLSALAKIYLLGVRFEVSKLEFKVNQEIFALLDLESDESIQDLTEDKFRHDLLLRIKTIRNVYKNTACDKDPLRKTLVTNMARHWECYNGSGGMADNEDGSESELSKFMEEIPRFAKDLVQYLRNSTPGVFAPPRNKLATPRNNSAKKRKISD